MGFLLLALSGLDMLEVISWPQGYFGWSVLVTV